MDTQIYILNIQSDKNSQLPDNSEYEFKKNDDDTIEMTLAKDQNMSEGVSFLHQHGVIVTSIRPKTNRMEQLYLHLLQK